MRTIQNSIYCLLFFCLTTPLFSQEIKGRIYEMEGDKKIPVPGVNIYDPEAKKGTVTDTSGKFHFHSDEFPLTVIISFVGYKNDTVSIPLPGEYEFILKDFRELDGVVVEARGLSTEISMIRPINLETMTKNELKKAACCNLSESFESNASVDAVYSDAVSGLRTIQMLGLSGNYIQTLTENTSLTRGLSSSFGTTFVPGPWVESIQITKGAGSVVNGFESMSGQINIEYLKAQNADPFYLNIYGNRMGRAETNIQLGHVFKKNWSTLLLAHGNGNFLENDHNHDRFLDNPLSKQYNILNRWKYISRKIEQDYVLRYFDDERLGGQLNFDHSQPQDTQSYYGTAIHNRQMEFLFKNGFLFPDEEFRTLGIIASARYHDLNSFYGFREYQGKNSMVNSSILYNDIIKNSLHQYKTGLSFIYDNYDEQFEDSLFSREEIIPGAFFEYNYTTPRFSFLMGVRGDYHSIYGLKPTIRTHLRFTPDPKTTLRASAGTGFRTANIFVENASVLASSRQIFVDEKLNPEETINAGGGFTRKFFLFNEEATFNADYYFTWFVNQVVVDLDRSPQEVHFYNLSGISYSHSAQADLDFGILKNLTAKLSFKYYDVKTTYSGFLLDKPLLSRTRFMQSISYKTKDKKWKFDYIGNWYGKARVPATDVNPVQYRMPDKSPNYYIMHFQITYTKKLLDLYVGAENILDFIQHDAIIDHHHPFSNYFDASLIWGPLNGRNYYIGLRYSIAKKKKEEIRTGEMKMN
jgi:outer membrane receptor for ferrienterochelin and colicins